MAMMGYDEMRPSRTLSGIIATIVPLHEHLLEQPFLPSLCSFQLFPNSRHTPIQGAQETRDPLLLFEAGENHREC